MKISNEIINKMAALLRESDSPEEIAKNPEEYLALGYFKDPELYRLTKHVLSLVIDYHPSLFFYYGVDKESKFKEERMAAAASLIRKDPLSALLAYKLHRRPEFGFLAIPMAHELKRYFGGEKIDYDSKLGLELSYLTGVIHKKYPYFFIEKGLTRFPRSESGEHELKQENVE